MHPSFFTLLKKTLENYTSSLRQNVVHLNVAKEMCVTHSMIETSMNCGMGS